MKQTCHNLGGQGRGDEMEDPRIISGLRSTGCSSLTCGTQNEKSVRKGRLVQFGCSEFELSVGHLGEYWVLGASDAGTTEFTCIFLF